MIQRHIEWKHNISVSFIIYLVWICSVFVGFHLLANNTGYWTAMRRLLCLWINIIVGNINATSQLLFFLSRTLICLNLFLFCGQWNYFRSCWPINPCCLLTNAILHPQLWSIIIDVLLFVPSLVEECWLAGCGCIIIYFSSFQCTFKIHIVVLLFTYDLVTIQNVTI